MCENHRHLGDKTTTSYAGRNYGQELEGQDSKMKELSEKRSQIIQDLSEDIAYLFSQNNDLRDQLGQPLLENLEVGSSEEALLQAMESLRQEHSLLKEQLSEQEANKKSVSEEDVDDEEETLNTEDEEVNQPFLEARGVEETPVVPQVPAKKKFWNFLKRK